MNWQEAMDLIVGILEEVAARCGSRVGGKRSYRTVRLAGGIVLGVDLLINPYGHIRVHLFGPEATSVLHNLNGSALDPAPLQAPECPKCRDIPQAYPAYYRGTGGASYFGYQWHTETSPNRDDIERIRTLVWSLTEQAAKVSH